MGGGATPPQQATPSRLLLSKVMTVPHVLEVKPSIARKQTWVGLRDGVLPPPPQLGLDCRKAALRCVQGSELALAGCPSAKCQ